MPWVSLSGGIVGLSLGLTGGGGSIFAVPLLVYALGLDFRSAVALSLAVVGLTSLYGAALQAGQGRVLWGAGAVLGAGGIFAAPLGAWLGGHMPERLSLLLFAGLMITLGIRMLRRQDAPTEESHSWISCQRRIDGRPHFTFVCAGKLLAAGAVSGVLSGIFGVGGGFLIVPALLLVACVDIETALATSLVGISLTAASGFVSNAQYLGPGTGKLALWFLGGSVAGMTLGASLKALIPGRGLKAIFGIAILGVAGFVVLRNLLPIQ